VREEWRTCIPAKLDRKSGDCVEECEGEKCCLGLKAWFHYDDDGDDVGM